MKFFLVEREGSYFLREEGVRERREEKGIKKEKE